MLSFWVRKLVNITSQFWPLHRPMAPAPPPNRNRHTQQNSYRNRAPFPSHVTHTHADNCLLISIYDKAHFSTLTYQNTTLCQFYFCNLNTAPHPHSPLPRLCAAGRDLCQLSHQARSRLLIRYTLWCSACVYVRM